MIRRRSPQRIQVLEYGRVALPEKLNTARVRERLVQAGWRVGKPAFEIRGRSLYAKGMVGVVDIGEVVVELLPKTHDMTTPDSGRVFLLELLRFTSGANHLAVSDAAVAIGDDPLLETVLAWAARSVMEDLRQGLPRRYISREETSTAVRGRISLRRAAQAHPGKELQLVVRHAPLSNDNPITQLLRWLLLWIFQSSRVRATKLRCQRLLQEDFSAVGDVTPDLINLDKTTLHPIEMHWAPVLRFARSIADQKIPNPTRAGTTESIAVLFTMHDLFEAALRKIFSKGLPNDIRLQPVSAHLLNPNPQDGRSAILRLKPDFRFSFPGDAGVAIGDAKWKMIVSPRDEVRPSEEDAYQLTAYLTALNAHVGFLFCPMFGNLGTSLLAESAWTLSGGQKPIHIISAHVPALIAAAPAGQVLRNQLCALIAAKLSATASHLAPN